jgi:hypothetical protein
VSVTRTTFASPVFWAMFSAYVAGVLLGGAELPPWWVGVLVAFACAAATNAIERWYIGPRRRTHVAWIEGSREFGGQSVTDSTVTGSITQVRGHRGDLNL